MAKQQQQPSRERERGAKVKVGKGKVTAVQVAFMVERYLEENKYSNALTAFRLDAADLFAKMHKSSASNKTAMKGLLGLGEILDEYISLKEQKLLLHRDRTRMDNAMHAFHNLYRSYFNDSDSSLPLSASPNSSSSPSPPNPNPNPKPYPSPSPNPNLIRPLSSAIPTTISTPYASNPISTTTTTTISTPTTTSTYPNTSNKRKVSTSDTLPASKMRKQHSHCSVVPSSSLIPPASKLVPASSKIQEKVQLVNHSIAKTLFKPSQPSSIASPETPQPNPSSNIPNPSTCSIVSSERSIIVSPLKGGRGAAYYSVERTCQFTSPLKPDARTSGKRDHVKGKLNFDNADVSVGPTEAAIAPNDGKVSSSPSTSSPSSSDGGENPNQVLDGFDFDFSEFDILNEDFSFSELLVDLDLDHDGLHSHSQSSPEQTNTSPR
jgi:hypothetical protein